MKSDSLSRFALCLALSLVTTAASAAINIDFVPVRNAGNAADPLNSGSVPGIGAVSYDYSIGKYEVKIGQYTTFLNAVAANDAYGLYNTQMGNDLYIKGILRSGSSGNYSYSVIGSANRPIAYVSWYDAARFANWMSNGQPTGSQNSHTTEDGAYALNGATAYASIATIQVV